MHLRRRSLLSLGGLFLLASLPTFFPPSEQLPPLPPRLPPSLEHLLGTDPLGRDLLQRLLDGSALSLTWGVLPALLALLFGMPLGLLVASGSRITWSLHLLLTLMLSLPAPLVLLASGSLLRDTPLGGLWGGSAPSWLVLGGLGAARLTWVTAGIARQLQGEPSVLGVLALGASRFHLWRRHLLPPLFPCLLPDALVLVRTGIVLEGFLSLLGIGVRPPTPSWGVVLADGFHLMPLAGAPALLGAFSLIALTMFLLRSLLCDSLTL